MGNKITPMYKNMYLGSMDEQTAEYILGLYEVDCVPELKKCIYWLSDESLEQVICYGDTYKKQLILEEDEYVLGELKDRQTTGVAVAFCVKKLLIGDSVGLGKTIISAGLINLCTCKDENTRFIFLTEITSIEEIRRKLIRSTGRYIISSTGEAKYVDRLISALENDIWCSIVASYSIMNNPKFYKWFMLNRKKFNILILDESGIIRKTSSEIHKTMKIVAKDIEYFIELNATPFETKLDDLYNQLSILDNKYLPIKSDFEKEFCIKSYTGMFPRVVGYQCGDIFREKTKLRYYSRTRKSLNAKFINNKAILRVSELSKEQKELMNKTTLWRLVCDCPTALDSDISFDEDTVPKLKCISDILQYETTELDTVTIYCYYKDTVHDFLKAYVEMLGYECEVINGSTPRKERDRIKKDFNDKKFGVLITNVQRGIDLTTCNTLVMYSFDYNVAKMTQVEGRITRTFDIENKNVYLLCSKGKEFNYLRSKIKKRLESAIKFTGDEYSLIAEIILKSLDEYALNSLKK